jgi:alkane 1-monooxygenase
MEVMKPWWRNRLVHYVGFQVALLATVAWSFGAWGALAFVLQSAVGIFLLEGVNYIEHYGLVRKEISKGVYEPFSDQHSWDCDSLMTNGTLFSLGMHAHHHGGRGGGLAMVPFEKLRPKASAPKLPWGYSLAILIACVPPLWISRMETHLPKNSSDSWQGSRAS